MNKFKPLIPLQNCVYVWIERRRSFVLDCTQVCAAISVKYSTQYWLSRSEFHNRNKSIFEKIRNFFCRKIKLEYKNTMFPGSGNFPRFGGKIWIDAHGSCSYECALCKNTFFSAGSFEFHITMVHNNDMKAMSYGQSNNNRDKNGNRDDTHSSSSNAHRSNAHNQSSGRRERQSGQLICTKCTNRFDSLVDLREHVRSQHQFECVYCPSGTIKSYETLNGLWLHQRNHHERKFPYKCKVCIRAFKRREELLEHKQSKHARGNDVQCDFCSKILMSAFEKENHIKKEHSDRRYYCFLCTEYWTTCQKNLRRHTKEKHPGRSQPKR